MPTAHLSPEDPGATTLVIDAVLVRSDRLLLAQLILVALLLIAFAAGWDSPVALLAYAVIMFGLLRHTMTAGECWNEFAHAEFDEAGVRLVRRGGEHAAPWKFFDDAKVEPVRDVRDPYAARDRWRLSFSNRFKPSIASFLHPRASQEVIFHAPLTLEFDAEPQVVEQLRELLTRAVLPELPKSPRPLRSLATPRDPAELFRLAACMRCEYPLRGLPAGEPCPECGWSHAAGTFMIDGALRSSSARGATLAIASVGAAVMFMCIAAPMFSLLPALLIVILAIVLLPRVIVRTARILATPRGLEVWRGGRPQEMIEWRRVGELHCTRPTLGQWRFTAWRDPKWSIEYSEIFDKWRTRPWSAPLLDVTLGGTAEDGRRVCEELERRWRAESGAPARHRPEFAPR